MFTKRLVLLSAALFMAAQLAACGETEVGEQVRDAAREAAEEAKATVGPQFEGTLEAKGEEVKGTLETKGEEIKPTAEAALEEVDQALTDLKSVSDRLDGWTEAVLTALGTLGEQSVALEDDPTIIADSAWRAETEAAISVLAERANDASEVAAELEADDKMPNIQSALADLGATLGDSAAELEAALQAEDAEMFLTQTEGLQRVVSAIDALGKLIGDEDQG